MGSFLDKPKTEKTNESGHGNELRYGLSAMQGWRIEMEDAHCSVIGLPGSPLDKWSFFAVFDGHAGGTVSKYAAKELLNTILATDPELFEELAQIYQEHHQEQEKERQQQKKLNESSSFLSSKSTTTTEKNKNDSNKNHDDNSFIKNCKEDESRGSSNSKNSNNNTNFNNNNDDKTTTTNSNGESPTQNENTTNNEEEQKTNKNDSNNHKTTNSTSTTTTNGIQAPKKFTKIYESRLKEAIRKAFLDIDVHMRSALPELDRGEDKSGSTAVACLISPSHVYLINCGDSRAILASGQQVALGTHDHKPINPCERERIQNAGGSVMIQRVNGSLAVSRALGDYEYKSVEGRGPCEQLVSPEPEIYSKERCEVNDEFVILACDGIWDVMSNEELREYCHSRLRVSNDLVKISNEVLDMCLSKGSRDNMSLIIVLFPSAPSVDQEEVDKDANCNEKIENRIKEDYYSTTASTTTPNSISSESDQEEERQDMQ